MKIVFPKNIFTSILLAAMPEQLKSGVTFKDAPIISQEIEKNNADLALMPSLDLIKHPDLLVSSKIALSFDGSLSNTYLYFMPNQNKFTDIYLNGDISSNEIILSKILFNEKYGSDVQIHLDTNKLEKIDKNYLLAGDINLINNRYTNGMSFADEISEMMFLPYVNYVAVSKNREALESFNKALKGMDAIIEDNIGSYLDTSNLTEESRDYIEGSLNSVYYEMTNSEVDGLKELIQMPYFHGIWDDMVDLKLV
ncbi:MAG: hypothetical protein Q8940_05130 [Bacteroidota bacterium]|nr:hypothetical protein [Bacteroidota bacterium]